MFSTTKSACFVALLCLVAFTLPSSSADQNRPETRDIRDSRSPFEKIFDRIQQVIGIKGTKGVNSTKTIAPRVINEGEGPVAIDDICALANNTLTNRFMSRIIGAPIRILRLVQHNVLVRTVTSWTGTNARLNATLDGWSLGLQSMAPKRVCPIEVIDPRSPSVNGTAEVVEVDQVPKNSTNL